LVQRINFNSGLGDAGEGALGTLTSATETTDSTGVIGDVVLGLTLELRLEMLKKGIIEVLTTKMGVTGGSLDGKYTPSDVKERDIKSSSSQVEDQDILLSLGLLIKTVSNGSGSGLVDDTQNFKTSNRTSVLGSQTLGVVEVSGNAN
jgi:hypothetical protein